MKEIKAANSAKLTVAAAAAVWRAFQALHQAGSNLLNVSVSADGGGGDMTISSFATTDSDGSTAGVRGLQVFVTNFSPMKVMAFIVMAYIGMAYTVMA